MTLRSSVAALLVVLVLGAAVLTSRADERSDREVVANVTRHSSIDPPQPLAAGWYLAASPPGSFFGRSGDLAARRSADEWAETARRRGYSGARVELPWGGSTACYTGPEDAEGFVGSVCPGSTTGARHYVVVLEGPYAPPADPSPDRKDEWYSRTQDEAQARAEVRGLPYETSLYSLEFRSSSELARVVRAAAEVVEPMMVSDGWYLAVTPGAFTTAEEISLGAAHAMALQAEQAGYENVRIVRWPREKKPCNPWGCEGGVAMAVYVGVLGGPFATVETAETAAQEQREAPKRPMVATPHVVALRFSEAARPWKRQL